MTTASPARIMEVGMGFWPAKVLLSAIELGLFTELGSTTKTGQELQAVLGLHSRANPDFCDTLVALEFLDRDGDGGEGRYRNTAGPPGFWIGAVPSSWAASWKWPTRASTGSGATSLKDLLNMLVEFGDAFDFTAADFFGWCREAGFSGTEVIPLAGPASAGVAYK